MGTSEEAIFNIDVIFGVLNLIIGISSIIMNFLVFFVYFKMNWKHPTYFLFINITFHDAMSGFTGIYMGIFLFFDRPEQISPAISAICNFMGFLWSLTAFTTPTLLCIASTYRFMAIYMAYSYKDMVNIKCASIGVISGWLIGLISALLPLLDGKKLVYKPNESVCDVDIDGVNKGAMVVFILIPLLAPLCVLMLCNVAVLLHLCKCTGRVHNKASEIHEEPLTPGTHSATAKIPQFGSICEWKNKVARRDYHTATTVVLMTLNYIFCYGLWIIYFLYRILEPDSTKRLFSDSKTGIIYIDATIKTLACFNSALNGIVHLVRGSQIRLQIKKLFRWTDSVAEHQQGHTHTTYGGSGASQCRQIANTGRLALAHPYSRNNNL